MIDFVRHTLAAKRIVRLVQHDEIFENVRVRVFRKWPTDEYKLSYLLDCSKCLSVWAGAVVVSEMLPRVVVDTLAVSEAVIMAMERSPHGNL